MNCCGFACGGRAYGCGVRCDDCGEKSVVVCVERSLGPHSGNGNVSFAQVAYGWLSMWLCCRGCLMYHDQRHFNVVFLHFSEPFLQFSMNSRLDVLSSSERLIPCKFQRSAGTFKKKNSQSTTRLRFSFRPPLLIYDTRPTINRLVENGLLFRTLPWTFGKTVRTQG